MLSVGRLAPKKGFHKLLDARSPEYEVVHAGLGAIPHEAPDGVRFLGPLNRTELRDLYQASNIFAFPALGEMLTLVMQEAMACGLQYGFDPFSIALVDPEPEVLRSAFLQILSDPDHIRYSTCRYIPDGYPRSALTGRKTAFCTRRRTHPRVAHRKRS